MEDSTTRAVREDVIDIESGGSPDNVREDVRDIESGGSPDNVREDVIDIESGGSPDNKSTFRSRRDYLLRGLPGLYISEYDEVDMPPFERLNRGEKEYYEKQVATLESFEKVDKLCNNEDQLEEQHDQELQHESAVYIAVNLSNFSNVLLLALKIYATVKSGSIAVAASTAAAASTLDSLLDLMALVVGILWFTHLSKKNINIYKYPIGKLRVLPVRLIVFAAIMATLGFQVLIDAVRQLIEDKGSTKMSNSELEWLYSIMLFATGVKLALWLYCRTSRTSIVRAYAKGHYFDVVTNVVGLAAAVLGDKFFWWIEPAGAIALALYTIIDWSTTVYENAASLVGQTAPPEMLQKLIYLVIKHDPLIQRVDTVRAYTSGVFYFVEVDIELPEDLPLKVAHTIGETLQIKIEHLPEVERAFVHLDFECDHKPEHSVLPYKPPQWLNLIFGVS